MKIICLILYTTLYSMVVFSQDTAKADYDYFIVLYTIGDNWDTTKQAYEQPYFKEHSTYLSELRKAKKIEVGGRYGDTGMILFKARDEEEVRASVTDDIAIKNDLFKVEIFRFDPFYNGCVE